MNQAVEGAGALTPGALEARPLLGRLQELDARVWGAVALLVACATGLTLALSANVIGVRAVPDVLRTAAVGLAFFTLTGFALARVVVRGPLNPYRPLLVLPVGAVASSMALSVLGLLHVPLKVSLVVLIAVAALAALWALRAPAGAPSDADAPSAADAPSLAAVAPSRSVVMRIVLPLMLAGMVGLISLIPIFRSGYGTVPGQNGDAILAVGSAVLLEHAPPTATRTDLPINHIPLEWRSKYPIYYALAAISTLAGQDPIQAFATVSALVLAMTALGFFLFARYLLRAPPWIALLALFLVPLDRIVMYVTIHPYYNELWGQFALPFILLTGWWYLSAPSRRSAVLFGLFLVLGLLAYPLVIPFPAAFLIVYAWIVRRQRRAAGERVGWISELRLPRPRVRPWAWIPVAVIGVPVVLVLVRGFLEKTLSAAFVFAPWTDLAGWHGKGLPYLPWSRFLGMPESVSWAGISLIVVCALAWFATKRIPPQTRRPMQVMVIGTALLAIYFRIRSGGELFFFKDGAFLGPYVLLLALLELAALAAAPAFRRAVLGLAGIGLAAVLVVASSAHEINQTYEQANLSILGLRGWDRQLPRGSSLRIDVPASGYELWVTYMFKDHPLSALDPLAGFFPHPVVARKADYVIANTDQPRPADAIGPVLLRNAQFQLWRMDPQVPGPDVSSRHLVDDISKITIS